MERIEEWVELHARQSENLMNAPTFEPGDERCRSGTADGQ
jgi:hypothetical protein